MPVNLTEQDDVYDVASGPNVIVFGYGGDDEIFGTDDRNILQGDSGDDYLVGAAGNDNLGGGSGNDILVGGTGIDDMFGGEGNDILDGGSGVDILSGDMGNDAFYVDDPNDRVVEYAGEGIDTVYSQARFFTLPANVENMVALGFEPINIYGNELNNVLTGNDAANFLNGMGGNDRMEGKRGSDTYTLDSIADQAIELPGGGVDLIELLAIYSVYTIPENFENLTTSRGGSVVGNAANNVIRVTSISVNGVFEITNDVIDGRAGADMMVGFSGDDTYYVDNAGDVVLEFANEGVDKVLSSITYTLGNHVEDLTLTGLAAINGTGNEVANKIVGNNAANVLDGRGGVDTMTGGLGADTYWVDDQFDIIVETGAGVDTVYSRTSVYFLPNLVENLVILIGNGPPGFEFPPRGFGNALNNTLTSAAGDDYLSGGLGADTMTGNAGDDTYDVDNAGDTVVEQLNQGLDTVLSSITYALTPNVEELRLDGAAAINGTGNLLKNTIRGNGAANVLDGGAEADILRGAAGNDTYIVDNAGDKVEEAPGGGTDTVNASISWTLSADVENLNLSGVAAINGTGNDLANRITGNNAANKLGGGLGVDILTGGLGADTYYVDVTTDKIVETGADIDTVFSTATTYTLAASVENLAVQREGGTGIGSELSNKLSGGAGSQSLNGMAGVDDMRGGLDGDTYFVDNSGDVIGEGFDQGADQVYATATYTLPNNVEVLYLMGAAAINGTGNNLSNIIIGNSAANLLNGGTADDEMRGGLGDDVYVVDNVLDRVREFSGQGSDTVNASVSYTLSGDIEHLNLTGAGALAGTGNALANRIVGNGAANVIDGEGGADTLTGGVGKDIFFFSVSGGIDTITDFAPIDDTMRLSNAAFGGVLTVGGAVRLISGATPSVSDGNPATTLTTPTFLYDTDDGRLFYDRDGEAAAFGAVHFATLALAPTITTADFQVVA
jgi:trimeric autotransporter adhesin